MINSSALPSDLTGERVLVICAQLCHFKNRGNHFGHFYPLYFKQLLGIPVAIVVIEVGGMNAYPCKNQDKGM